MINGWKFISAGEAKRRVSQILVSPRFVDLSSRIQMRMRDERFAAVSFVYLAHTSWKYLAANKMYLQVARVKLRTSM